MSDTSSATWTCSCGQVNDQEDKFCANCGQKRPDEEKEQALREMLNENVGSREVLDVGHSRLDEVAQAPAKNAEKAAPATAEVVHGSSGEARETIATGTANQPTRDIPRSDDTDMAQSAVHGSDTVTIPRKYMYAGIGALVFCIVAVGAYALNKDESAAKHQAVKMEEPKETTPVKETKKVKQYSGAYKLARSELSLNGISLGDYWKDVQDMLGKPVTSKPEAGRYVRNTYKDLDVVVRNGVVEALVSHTDEVATKQGIRQGNSLSDVLSAYGSDYLKTDDGDTWFYEYAMNTEQRVPAMLRFAVNKSDNTVQYISVRTLTDEVVGAKTAFTNFHQAISQRDTRRAFGYLDGEFQNSVGGYSKFSQGYANVLSSKVSNFDNLEVTPSRIVFVYTLEARDRIPSQRRIRTQYFDGQVTMVQENGQWLIDEIKQKKSGETMD